MGGGFFLNYYLLLLFIIIIYALGIGQFVEKPMERKGRGGKGMGVDWLAVFFVFLRRAKGEGKGREGKGKEGKGRGGEIGWVGVTYSVE